MSSEQMQKSQNASLNYKKSQNISSNKTCSNINSSWLINRPNQKAKSTYATCVKIQQNDQILHYKQKAHQSFMQVIQVQQLHQEQIQQLKEEYQKRILELTTQLDKMNQTLRLYQRNNDRHLLKFADSFAIQGLDIISCQQTNQTKIDQSEILNFQSILNQKSTPQNAQNIKSQIFQIINDYFTTKIHSQHVLTLKLNITKLFDYINQIQNDIFQKVQLNEILSKRLEQVNEENKKFKINVDSVKKQFDFLTQHIKKLSGQKNILQKKISVYEKSTKINKNQQLIKQISFKQIPIVHKLVTEKQIGKSKSSYSKIKTFESSKLIKKQDQQNQHNDSFSIQDLIVTANTNKDFNKTINEKKNRLFVSINQSIHPRKKSFDQ